MSQKIAPGSTLHKGYSKLNLFVSKTSQDTTRKALYTPPASSNRSLSPAKTNMAVLKLAIIALTLLSSALATTIKRATIAAKKSSGCGTNYADLTQPAQYLDAGGKNRSYYIHLPPTYDSNRAHPMVVGFHGSQSIGLFLAIDSKLNETRYSGDKIMVYPNGEGGSWAGPSYHNGSSVQEDIDFVADVIKDVEGKYCVDEERVFGVG